VGPLFFFFLPRPAKPITDWLARVHAGRRGADLMGTSPDTTVADPTTSGS